MIGLSDRDPRRLRTGRWFRRLGRAIADIPVISHLKPDTKWLAKAELFRVPVSGWMPSVAGDVPVDRSDPPQER